MSIWDKVLGGVGSLLLGKKSTPATNIPTPYYTPAYGQRGGELVGQAQNLATPTVSPYYGMPQETAAGLVGQDPYSQQAMAGMQYLANNSYDQLLGANRNLGYDPSVQGLDAIQRQAQTGTYGPGVHAGPGGSTVTVGEGMPPMTVSYTPLPASSNTGAFTVGNPWFGDAMRGLAGTRNLAEGHINPLQPPKPGDFTPDQSPLRDPLLANLASALGPYSPSTGIKELIASLGPQRYQDTRNDWTGMMQGNAIHGAVHSQAGADAVNKMLWDRDARYRAQDAQLLENDRNNYLARQQNALAMAAQLGNTDYDQALRTYAANLGAARGYTADMLAANRGFLDELSTRGNLAQAQAGLGLQGQASARSDIGTMGNLYQSMFGMGESARGGRLDAATTLNQLLMSQPQYMRALMGNAMTGAQAPYWSPTGPVQSPQTDYSGAISAFADFLRYRNGPRTPTPAESRGLFPVFNR